MRSFLALSLLGFGAAIGAQSAPHSTTIPKVSTGEFTATPSSFPFGRTGGRVQYWYRGDNLPLLPVVTAIGPRPARGVTTPGRTQSVEIVMANTTLGFGTITKSFAQNLGAHATIVFARKTVNLVPLTSHADPDAPSVWIQCDLPFPLLGPNLIVDFDLGPAAGAASVAPNGDMLLMSANASRHWISDRNCGGTLTATSTTAAFTLTLNGATPQQSTWMLLSGEAAHMGGLGLPYRLDGLGMTGCLLGVDPQVIVAGTADAAGTSTLSVPFTVPTDSFVVYGQAIHRSSANPLGLATTNVTRSVLGGAGLCNYIYNFTVDGALAQNGPYAYNIAGNLMFKP